MEKKKNGIIIKTIPTRGLFRYKYIYYVCVCVYATGRFYVTNAYTVFGLMIRFYASAILGAARVCDAVLVY